MAKGNTQNKSSASSANLGFEAKLWLTADKLRNNMDAAEYKHVVLGLIFLKYISDTFEEHRAKLLTGKGDYKGAIHHLAPQGMAGFVLANGSMSSNQSGEGEIRKAIIKADLVDCMVALPGQLFYSTQIPVCLWFLTKDKSARVIKTGSAKDLPDCLHNRKKEALFIDARKMGTLVDRVHRELTDADLDTIVSTYHTWRLDFGRLATGADKRGILIDPAPLYVDVPGFCKSATTAEIAAHGRDENASQGSSPARVQGARSVL